MCWQEFWVSEAPYYLCLSMVEVFPSKSAIFLLAVNSSLALVIYLNSFSECMTSCFCTCHTLVEVFKCNQLNLHLL